MIGAVLADGRLSGGAPVVSVYEQALSRWFRVARAVAVNSGTSALHATLAALDVKPGTEVLVPATAPLPTAMPILTCGATPVIVDTLPYSLALDPADVERKLTGRTGAAITLPLWGYPNDDQHAAAMLATAGVPIVEDACQAHGTKVRGRYAGTYTTAGCVSTHDRKPLATGDGGFVLTNDPELAERIDFYHPPRPPPRPGPRRQLQARRTLAAVGLRRLPRLQAQLDARRRNARRILDRLPSDGLLHEMPYPDGDQPNYYTLVLTTSRQYWIAAALDAIGLPPDSRRYRYRPLHQQPLFAKHATDCPNAETLATSTSSYRFTPACPRQP